MIFVPGNGYRLIQALEVQVKGVFHIFVLPKKGKNHV